MVINTLVDPRCPVGATHIHGITTDDVMGAPTFSQIARDVENALAGCALVAYNAYFDVRFLRQEFNAIGKPFEPPYMCLMNLSSHLHLTAHCSLSRACELHRIVRRNAHTAAADAEAAAAIWRLCRESLASQSYGTFRDLSIRCRYAFTKSFVNRPLPERAPARATWEPILCDASERAKRIGDWAKADDLAQELRWLFAARAELDAARRALQGKLSDGDRTDIAFKLFAVELGLVSAGTQATPQDWDRLHFMVDHSGS
jgi:DNA polymerase III epsilon subunit-like protein